MVETRLFRSRGGAATTSVWKIRGGSRRLGRVVQEVHSRLGGQDIYAYQQSWTFSFDSWRLWTPQHPGRR